MVVEARQHKDIHESSDTPRRGLTQAEVAERVARGETNRYKARVSRSYWDIVRDNLLNLFNIVLGSLLIIVIWLGDYATAFFAGFSVVTNTFLGMFQEIQARRKLDQLAALSEQQVMVYRDGALVEIPMRDVVRDDILTIEPGNKLVVDGLIIEADALEIDESLLTGESDAVLKQIDDEVFSGSFCLAGSGLMKATRVGRDSNINKLSDIAKQYKRTKTPTQNRIDIIVELTVVVMFIFVPMLFISTYMTPPTPPFLDVIRNAVVFVTSLVPQGLVLVAILSLTIGAIRISRHQTLIQRVNAVESLANATVLCFDKTGTLTMNQLAVTELISLTGESKDKINTDLLHYLHNLSHLNRTAQAVQDYALQQVDAQFGKDKLHETPFTSVRKWGAVRFSDETLILGAPERLLPKLHADDSVSSRAMSLAQKGMRVLAFARSTEPIPENSHDLSGLCQPIALVVLSDQIRGDISETLSAFTSHGLALKVISGDNIETVRAIAGQAGMDTSSAYTGTQIDEMPDAELDAVVMQASVFGRVEPDTKRRIVEALQRQKQYVAMVGDGVNDVPALKQADLAIVMNDGTQISKDVADIVLLNNAMSTLPLAFEEGREITQTIFGTMKMFLIKNLYNVMLFVFIAFMSLPFPITPVQISWSTFGTVNIPATLIAFGIIRPRTVRNFRNDVLDYIITGGLIGAVLLALLYIIVYFGTDRDVVATRSAVTVFLTLYGALVVCSIQGVDTNDASSFVAHKGIILMMTVLVTLTISAMFALPDLFDFYTFTWANDAWIIILITALFLLAMIIFSHGMRYRYLLRRLWALVQP